MNVCHNCGYQFALTDVNFCPKCGTSLFLQSRVIATGDDGLDENNNDHAIGIGHTEGDVIGIGVDGNGNIIGKNISIVVNEAQTRYGLSLLSPDYFKNHKSTDQDLENWRKGFSFKLESIKQNLEFKRSITEDIKLRLEEKNQQHCILLLGESGTSKSTILMEIMCDYFDKGYKILYTYGETNITNGTELTKFIEDLPWAYHIW